MGVTGCASFRPRDSAQNWAVSGKIPSAAPPSGVIFEAMIRPNRSMDARQSAVCVICFAVLSLTIALSFFSVGLWLVLPFSGLEVLAVGVGIGYTIKRSQGYEWIVVTDRDVSVLQSQSGKSRRYEFQRYWTQVRLEHGSSRLQPQRLLIGSHGRFVEIGREFIDEDRKNFAARLKEAITSGRKDTLSRWKSNNWKSE